MFSNVSRKYIIKPYPKTMSILGERMKTRLLDGRQLGKALTDRIRQELELAGIKPGLAVVLVGDNEASKLYVGSKQKKAQELGMRSFLHRLPADISEDELLGEIEMLSGRDDVHGILVQLPLPSHMDPYRVQQHIPPAKDVDGLNPFNQGALVLGRPTLVPCTPLGILYLLSAYGIPLEGKHAVIVGRSAIVGKPMALLLLEMNASVSVCHSKTKDLGRHTIQADIVVAAVGRPGLIQKTQIKEGATVVDVGQNRLETGRLVGDADLDGLVGHAGFLTPIPGGVGPMTVALLMWNTLLAFLLQEKPKAVRLPMLEGIHERLFGHLNLPLVS